MFVLSECFQWQLVSVVAHFKTVNDFDESDPQFLFGESAADAHAGSEPERQHHKRVHHAAFVPAAAVAAVTAPAAAAVVVSAPILSLS